MTSPDASSFVMRPAVLQDLNVLLAIDSRCFPPGIAYPRNEIASLLRAPAVLTVVAERPQGIVGFASLGFKQQRHSARSISSTAGFPSGTEPSHSFSFRKAASGDVSPGLVSVELLSQLRAELITIDVLPEFRRQHFGWRLHRALEQEFHSRSRKSSHGGRRIELHVAVENAAAIAFYRRLGYRILERVPRYYLDSVDAWRMEKNLSDPP